MADIKQGSKYRIPDVPDLTPVNEINARMRQKTEIRRSRFGVGHTDTLSEADREEAKEFLNRLVEHKGESKG